MSASAWAQGTHGSFSMCYPCSRSNLLPIFPVEQSTGPLERDVGQRSGRSADAEYVVITFSYPNPSPPSMLHVTQHGMREKHDAHAGTRLARERIAACPM
jgi:hypothetical protein